MEQTIEPIPSPATKKADEKFCSECGLIIKVKAEICPNCGVRQLPTRVPAQYKINFFSGNLIQKFLYTTVPAFLLFIVILRTANRTSLWMSSITASMVPALFVGVIAMALPTNRKIIYIPCSIAIIFLLLILATALMIFFSELS